MIREIYAKHTYTCKKKFFNTKHSFICGPQSVSGWTDNRDMLWGQKDLCCRAVNRELVTLTAETTGQGKVLELG